MPAVRLSARLRRRIAAVAWRLRLLRVIRHLSLVVLVLVAAAALAALADWQLSLPAGVRQGLVEAWLVLAGIGLLGGLLTLVRRIPARAVAACIEKCYPQLEERLTSAVEISAGSGPGHGSPAFLTLLVEEVEKQAQPLSFRRAVPLRRLGLRPALAFLALLLAVTPSFVWPGEFHRLRERFLDPWQEEARVEEPEPSPEKSAPQPEKKRPPQVGLAAESPEIRVIPPAYARGAIDPVTLHGLVDVAGLEHSAIHFDFAFTHPVVSAFLECQPGASKHPLKLSADRRQGSCTLTADGPGSYRLVVEGQQGVRTELPGGKVATRPDQPPVFLHVDARENLPYVVAHDRLPLAATLTDDVAVTRLELEYRADDGPVQRERISLRGANTRQAQGRHVFALAGKVAGGKHLLYRFRAEDNLPANYHGPHVVYYPADRWLMLRVAENGQTVREREVLSSRDDVRRQLAQLRAELARQQRSIYRLQQETNRDGPMSEEHKEQLEKLRKDNQEARQSLQKLAEQADREPGMQELGEQARAAAEQEMKASQEALEKAGTAERPERKEELRKADREVDRAMDRLQELKKLNDRLTQKRLEEARLQALADRQQLLAEQARKLAEKDAASGDELDQLRQQQERTTEKLQDLARESDRLKKEIQAARQEAARETAEQARDMARRQRDLARAQDQTDRQQSEGKATGQDPAARKEVGELVRRQQKLAQQGEDLARQVEQEQGKRTEPAEQARKAQRALQQAAQQMRAGALPDAKKSGAEAADQLRRLKEQLARSPVPDHDPQLPDALQQAQNMEQQQAEQNRRLEPLAKNADAQKAQQEQEQRSLQQQTEELSRELARQAQQARRSARPALQHAGEEAREAEQAMQQAQDDKQERRQMQEQAARHLEQAGQQASQAAAQDRTGKPQQEQAAGQSLRRAHEQMQQAEKQLEKEKPAEAAPRMERAAQALQQASRRLTQEGSSQPAQERAPSSADAGPSQNGTTAEQGGRKPAGRVRDQEALAPGRAWGELPGELRTRILQEMKAEYGEDYARMIKLYFEQLASPEPSPSGRSRR